MKKLILVLIVIVVAVAADTKMEAKAKPPLGCGTDSAGVKYCCNPYGHCWPENW